MKKFQPIRLLYMSAQPVDQYRLRSEFDNVSMSLSSAPSEDDTYSIHPIWETDYSTLLDRLRFHRPHILHYSGHGKTTGLCLMNLQNRKTQPLNNEELIEILEGHKAHLEFVFLNSCSSYSQAAYISNLNIYVLGINSKVDDIILKQFAETFYSGFGSQISPVKIPKAIKIGLKVVVKKYPDFKNIFSLWINGAEVDYEKIYTSENIDETKLTEKENLNKSIVKFNFNDQKNLVLDKIKANKFCIFSLDNNGFEESKFIFSVIEDFIKQSDINLATLHIEVMTFSKLSKKEIIEEFIDYHTGFLRNKPVMLCIIFESFLNKSFLTEIINNLSSKPPITKDYPCLLFLLPRQASLHIDNLNHIPNSAYNVSSEIVKGKGECALPLYLNYFLEELYNWIDKESIHSINKDTIPGFFNDYCDDIKVLNRFIMCGDKQYIFSFFKEIIRKYLGFDIIFDNRLQLKLKKWE